MGGLFTKPLAEYFDDVFGGGDDDNAAATTTASSAPAPATTTTTTTSSTSATSTTTTTSERDANAEEEATVQGPKECVGGNVQPTSDYGDILCPPGFTTENKFGGGEFGDCPQDKSKPCNRCQLQDSDFNDFYKRSEASYMPCGGNAQSAWPHNNDPSSSTAHLASIAPSCSEGYMIQSNFPGGPMTFTTGLPREGCP